MEDEHILEKYQVHIAEKEAVRNIKKYRKNLAQTSAEHGAGIFNLQQVMYTPSGTHSALFYRRRLANYNFTVCDLKNKQGYCQLWHECIAGRGACEICTGVYNFLNHVTILAVRKSIYSLMVVQGKTRIHLCLA